MKKLLSILLLSTLWTCNEEDKKEEKLSPENELIFLKFLGEGDNAIIANEKNKYTVKLPYTTVLTNLKPAISVSEGAEYEPEHKNFSDPNGVKYIVTAEDGTVQDYLVTVHRTLSPEKELTLIFHIDGKEYSFNAGNKHTLGLPHFINLKKISPLVRVSKEADYSPKNQNDFSKTVIYTVTAENKSKKDYKVTVIRNLSPEKELINLTFEIDETLYTATKDNDNNYTLTLPHDIDLADLPTPEVTVSYNAQYNPQNQTNFNETITYTVTAEDETTQDYKVNVIRNLSPEKELTNLTFEIDKTVYTATKDKDNDKHYTLTLPPDIDLATLPTPEVTVSEKAQYTPQNQTDFSNPVTYTVTAEDQTTQDYQLTVINAPAFKTLWETTTDGESITLPIWNTFSFKDDNDVQHNITNDGTYNFTVDWGDKTKTEQVTSATDEGRKHTYAKAGEYTVTITGTLEGFNFNVISASKNNFISVKEWNKIALGPAHGHFERCENLESFTATDAPDLSETTSFKSLFKLSSKFNSNISHWNTKNITDMSYMFNSAKAFNQKLTFDTQNVTNMRDMFTYATVFNNGGESLSLNTQKVTDMSYMFKSAQAFDQSLTFDTQKVNDMNNMFRGASVFNQTLNFNTDSVTNMSFMFYEANKFNNGGKPLNFNTEIVTDMNYMFYAANKFNNGGQPLTFKTDSVTDMSYMFNSAKEFNQTLNFNTEIVTDMSYMFYSADKFNNGGQPLTFTTDSVTNMSNMFHSAYAFNQELNFDTKEVTNMNKMFYSSTAFNNGGKALNFKTASVTNMDEMFHSAKAFNQNLSGWCVKHIDNKPKDFDRLAHKDFANNQNKQPKWGVDCQQ